MTGHRPTIRLKLTIMYGALFVIAGILLIAVTYGLVRRELAPNAPLHSVNRIMQTRPDANDPDQGEPERQVRREERLNALRQLWRQSLWALAITSLGVLALGWFLAGELLAPLRRITEHARLSSATTLDKRLHLAGPEDELKGLADTFDGMLDRLEAAFRAQQGFAAQASHELRTPLAIIRAEAELARGNPDTSQRERDSADAILLAVERSDRLVDGLLALTRSESTMLELSPVDLADLTGDVVGEYVSEADRAQVRIELSLDSAIVGGDASLLRRLVSNLVQNAIRYNVPGGTVSVGVDESAASARLLVENSGAAVDPDEVDRLFEPFTRGEWARRNRTGFGLGLSIAQSIVRAHRGSISASPRAEGGLRVEVLIPLAAQSATPAL